MLFEAFAPAQRLAGYRPGTGGVGSPSGLRLDGFAHVRQRSLAGARMTQHSHLARRLKPLLSQRLARGDLSAIKSVVRISWPKSDTAEIAAAYRLPEHLVVKALSRVREEDRARLHARGKSR